MLERAHQYLKDKLDYPLETKDTDYKSAVKFDEQTDFAAKLVKHILGFANSGGGYIIVGFREKANKIPEPDPAITEEIVPSYEVTRLCQHVEKYLLGQDRIKIEIPKIASSQRVTYPIISIGRFPEYPFVCTKGYVSKSSGEPILESGQIYIRTEGARTLTVKAPSEWRQLIRECIKASQEIEAKRPTGVSEEEGAKAEEIPREAEKPVSVEKSLGVLDKVEEAEKQFAAWIKNENDNAINEMKSAGFTEGFFKYVIKVPHEPNQIDSRTLLEIARKSECHNTGWPIGVVMTNPEYKPIPLADGIRAIMIGKRSIISDIDSFDYWALNNRGHFFFVRSYEEDATPAQELAKKDKFLWFDIAIWSISEMFCYTSNLCTELNLKQSDNVELTLYYEGLKGRVLSASRHGMLPSIRTTPSVENIYENRLELEVGDIMSKLKDHVYQTTLGLFALFDFTKFDRVTVDSIVDDFLNSRL